MWFVDHVRNTLVTMHIKRESDTEDESSQTRTPNDTQVGSLRVVLRDKRKAQLAHTSPPTKNNGPLKRRNLRYVPDLWKINATTEYQINALLIS